MTEHDARRPKKTLGDRAREVTDRVRDALGDILEALDDLVAPLPAPRPVPIRNRYPRRR